MASRVDSAVSSALRTPRNPHPVAVTAASWTGALAATRRNASYAAAPTAPVTTVPTTLAKNPCAIIEGPLVRHGSMQRYRRHVWDRDVVRPTRLVGIPIPGEGAPCTARAATQ